MSVAEPRGLASLTGEQPREEDREQTTPAQMALEYAAHDTVAGHAVNALSLVLLLEQTAAVASPVVLRETLGAIERRLHAIIALDAQQREWIVALREMRAVLAAR